VKGLVRKLGLAARDTPGGYFLKIGQTGDIGSGKYPGGIPAKNNATAGYEIVKRPRSDVISSAKEVTLNGIPDCE
jgi:hypothetical protein